MSEFNVTVPGGESLRLLTGGKYCPADILVTAEGGGSEKWIGDGNTHIWITLNEGRTSPMLGVCPNGSVTVDWGDGTTPDTLTGTSTTAAKWTPSHNYAEPGDYVITLTVDGEMGFNVSYPLLRHASTSDARNNAYGNAIRKVEISNGVKSIANNTFRGCSSLKAVSISNGVTSIGGNAFVDCYSLEYIIIPDSVKSFGGYAFAGCYSLNTISIPDGVTTISDYTFLNCYSLTSVSIPNSVTSIGTGAFKTCKSLSSVKVPNSVTKIGDSAFAECSGVRYYDFIQHTAIPELTNSNAFNQIPTDCEIRVPASLYDAWKAATNWTAYASHIVPM